MAFALLFPGQGTQHAQMLPWLDHEAAAAPLLARLAATLGGDWRARLADPAWATRNAVAQPLLVGVQLAAWACLAPLLPPPAVVAGYSVGELAAVAAAGVCDASAALGLALARAAAMDAAAHAHPGGLVAVRDLGEVPRAHWCARHGLALAIRLGPDRAIVGGPPDALERAATDPAVAHARIDRIGVQIASHTPAMRSAVDAVAAHLAALPLQDGQMPVVCNLTGSAATGRAALAHALSHQIASPVLWDSCMLTLAERGVQCVLEVGPGTTLAALWRERFPDIPVRSADEFRSAQAAAAWVGRALAR